ncbi:hypothetical protein PLICRDRAFT_180361 [Plicaturopsis crispa FD-325 SS-3]|uniref:Unplaced genomic scaffold PLICRscaffold_24, whole genome shotgun sequence n=1 Tax=Plicaturopsis crispa FD-325 SS-3 TaxID=944288 RepID=A0A0C9SKB7_PLICR|nr:hypothetical protein PLICRDRAFT_180361 [Plicaturopsis crispa FD-325 SS-3]
MPVTVPNSAATERLFSKFGAVHSKPRNRMKPERVRKTTMVKTDIEEEFPRKRSRRQLVDYDSSSDEESASDRRPDSSQSTPVTNTPASADVGAEDEDEPDDEDEEDIAAEPGLFDPIIDELLDDARQAAEQEDRGSATPSRTRSFPAFRPTYL